MAFCVRRFIDEYEQDISEFSEFIKYSAGIVKKDERRSIVSREQFGAREMFSIGQPVYDGDGNLLGYLGIGVYRHLDYSPNIHIPVERWEICNETSFCKDGVKIYTYWQNEKRKRRIQDGNKCKLESEGRK